MAWLKIFWKSNQWWEEMIVLKWNTHWILQDFNAHLNDINTSSKDQIDEIKKTAQEKIEQIEKQRDQEIERINKAYIHSQAQALIWSSLEQFEDVMDKTPEELKKPLQDEYFPLAFEKAKSSPKNMEIVQSQAANCNWTNISLLNLPTSWNKKSYNPKSALLAVLAAWSVWTVAYFAWKHTSDQAPPAQIQPNNSIPAAPLSPIK